ncbi:nuclear transport factor 2 family protein [Mycobacterium sp. 94-17]|uniref:nuclear transport factor 2 family protein n=1 Tax=Mycobacterium sp. 94-17 TaxID=2986147 RepID=UPI002D1EE746|nr:nuclear transport factor 2 family protein [Mycobacterium sp. 94-17]MEB4212270.1 nuclear transport factor 2 family protein [Mycobacterium sp. 94-17]
MTLSVEQRSALSDVVHRYAAYVDDREFNAAAELFTDDAELLVPAPPADLQPVRSHRGRRAIGMAVAAVATVARTEHAIIGEVYDAAAADTARGRIAGVAHHWNERDGELVDVAWHLRYDDEYVLTGAGWRIGRRALTVHAIETRPVRRLLPPDAS